MKGTLYPSHQQPGVNVLYILKWDYRLPVGKMKGLRTVKELFDMGPRWRDYLGWVYYHYEFISFKEDILQALHLTPMEKPGRNPEAYAAWVRSIEATLTEEEKAAKVKNIMGRASHRRRLEREAAQEAARKVDSKADYRDSRISSAARLAWYNQGHRDSVKPKK